MIQQHEVSIRQACKAAELPRTTLMYKRKPKEPGKPMQNGYVERCNGSIRSELLNAYVFKSLSEVRQKADEWMMDYNFHRPHKALNYQTPMDLL